MSVCLFRLLNCCQISSPTNVSVHVALSESCCSYNRFRAVKREVRSLNGLGVSQERKRYYWTYWKKFVVVLHRIVTFPQEMQT